MRSRQIELSTESALSEGIKTSDAVKMIGNLNLGHNMRVKKGRRDNKHKGE
jgi:hypothetical protein